MSQNRKAFVLQLLKLAGAGTGASLDGLAGKPPPDLGGYTGGDVSQKTPTKGSFLKFCPRLAENSEAKANGSAKIGCKVGA
jgi:hypothetical protein